MRIAAPHILNLLEFASYIGYRPSVLKKHLTNAEADLSLFENNISDIELVSIYKELLKRSGDDYLGLHYGCFLNIKAMGMIFTISRSATDLEQAIAILKKFMEATFPVFTFIASQEKQTYRIEVLCDINNLIVRKHLCDATLSVMYREMRLITDDTSKIQIRVPYKNIDEYKKMLGDDVRKGSSYSLLLDKKEINKSLNSKNILNIAQLLPSFLRLIESTKETNCFPQLVKKMILNMSEPELPGFDKVASQFSMGNRSFQRKLKADGSSFRKISDGIKCDLSKYLQESQNLKTQDIAHLLGYSGTSAYLHAKKKWKFQK